MQNNTTEKIQKLEKNKVIQIGIHKQKANALWIHNSMFGKFLNILTPVLFVFSFFVLEYGFFWFFASMFCVALYSWCVIKVAAIIARIQIINDEHSRELLYFTGLFNIRVVKTNEIISPPRSLEEEINKLFAQTYR